MTTVPKLLSDVLAGHRLTTRDAEFLLSARGRDVWRITAAADEMRERRAGDTVTYVRNQNLHVTNICKNLCGFCGFGRKATDEGAYCHDQDRDPGAGPARVRAEGDRDLPALGCAPGVYAGYICRYHALDPRGLHQVSISMPSARTRLPMRQTKAASRQRRSLARLKEEGLGTIQGTAAEILVDSVRQVICPRKVSYCRLGPDHQRGPCCRPAVNGNHHVRVVRDRPRPGRTPRHPAGDPGRDARVHGACHPSRIVHTNTPLYQQGIARPGPPAGKIC